jgi:hypothetical protein
MGVVNTTYTFSGTDTITSAKLNNIIDDTFFIGDAIQGTTLQVVSPGKLAVSAGGITSNELASNSVATANIVDANVTTAKIANLNVTTEKIANLNVTTEKIAESSVTTEKIAAAAIGTAAEVKAETASKLVTADRVKQSPAAAKAYGSFTTATSARTLSGSYNVSSVTRIGSGSSQVTFTSPMATAAYTVVAQSTDSGTSVGTLDIPTVPYNKSTTGFKIDHPQEATDRAVDFVVFGTLA